MILENSEIAICVLQIHDLEQVANIHLNAFPQAALTRLGREAIRRYYEWQLIGPHNCLALGAFANDSMVGFCFAGTFRGSFTGFIRKNKNFLIFRVITHPWLLLNSLFINRVRLAVKSLWKRKVSSPSDTVKKEPSFGILAIAVDPDFQGNNFGYLLLSKSEKYSSLSGYTKMHLTVHPDNSNAVKFYIRNGWKKIPSDHNWTGRMEKNIVTAESNA